MELTLEQESARLAELHSFAILDTPSEPRFDAITELAADICGTPYALITLLDDSRQWFKSRKGFADPETTRSDSFCQYALGGGDILEIPDALVDPRFRDNRYVLGDPKVRFYAGAPLTAPSGHVLGTLCVLDTMPRALTASQRSALATLSALVMTELQLRRALTTQEQLTQAYEKQNLELVDAQAVARVGSWVADLEQLTIRWSPETHRIFQTDPAQYAPTRDSYLEWVPVDERARVEAAFNATALTDGATTVEHHIVRSDGSLRLIQNKWQAYRRADGTPTHVVGTVQDVTDARQAELRLRRLNRVYALLSEVNDVIMHEHDRGRLFQRACEVAVEVGGLRGAWVGLRHTGHADVLVAAIHGVVPAYVNARRIQWSDTPEGNGPTGRAVRTNSSVICNDVATDPAMAPWRAEALATGFRSSASFPLRREGEAIGALSLYADSPGWFDAEEQAVLERMVSNLCYALSAIDREEARRLAQHEREMLEQQLLRAQRLESIGTLAGGIAHDLNNVLTPIVFSIDMLRDGLADDSLEPVLDEMARSARRGADMVRQLLVFARGADTERRPMSIDVVLLDIVATIQETFPRSIVITTEIGTELPWVVGDRTQLHQVVLNLCLNARDAMKAGGGLTVRANVMLLASGDPMLPADSPAGTFVVVEVEDTGHGMSADVLLRIFDPFFTTKAVGEGTGLGLSTSRSIVKSLGGFIHVESTPGEGTVFRIGLPAVEQGTADALPEAQAHLPRGAGERVLLVDDEAPIRQLAGTLLTTYGYQVTVCSNGAEALGVFQRNPDAIDIVVTDLMMPIMDGVDLIAAVRIARPDVPIIASSGFHDEARRTAIEAMLVTDFLPKPYTAEAMLRALRQALQSDGSTDTDLAAGSPATGGR